MSSLLNTVKESAFASVKRSCTAAGYRLQWAFIKVSVTVMGRRFDWPRATANQRPGSALTGS